MAGETSEGMLFDIGYADGLTPALADRPRRRCLTGPAPDRSDFRCRKLAPGWIDVESGGRSSD